MQYPGGLHQSLPKVLHGIAGQGIDAVNIFAVGNLHQAEFSKKSLFTHELGIDAEAIVFGQVVADRVRLIDKCEIGHCFAGRLISNSKTNMR